MRAVSRPSKRGCVAVDVARPVGGHGQAHFANGEVAVDYESLFLAGGGRGGDVALVV